MSVDHKEILKTANAAITEGDYEGFLSHCTDDTEWTFVGEQTLKGKEAVRQWMAENYIKPPKFKVSDMIADGELVVAMGEITISAKNGGETQYSYCDVWSFRDGKLSALKAFVIEA